MKKLLNIIPPTLLFFGVLFVCLHYFAPTYLPWNNSRANNADLEVITKNFIPNLHHLDFRSKFQTSKIPDICEILEGNNLRYDIWSIDLADNQLTSVPDLTCLENLKELNLSYNQLTRFPQLNLSNSLEILNMSNNQLSSVANLADYRKLIELQISYNQLQVVDAALLPPNVIDVSLQHNQIESLIGFPVLKSLTSLKLEYNRLTETVFDDLGGILPQLKVLTLGENSVSAEKVMEWNKKSAPNLN